MNQQERVEAYTSGKVLFNDSRSKKDVIVFKFFGNMYSTNELRQKKYAFDDEDWQVINVSWRYKLGQVYMGNVKKLKDCKKSINAGVK